MKKILFIIPPWRTCNKLTHKLYPFPLGSIYLGTMLKEKGYVVTIKDFLVPAQYHKAEPPKIFGGKSAPPYQHWGQPMSECIEWLSENIDDFDCVCLCMGQCNLFETSEILGRYISIRKPLVIGGAFVTTHVHEALKRTKAHIAVVGEGELVIEHAVLSAINMFNKGFEGTVLYGEKVKDLDTLPLPDYSLVNLEDYPKYNNKTRAAISLTRGCPHSCEFCSVRKIFGKRWIRKSKERIKAEILNLWNRGVKYFIFVDDNLFFTEEMVNDITDVISELKNEIPKFKTCKFYQEEGVEVRIASNFELLKKIYDAGFENITIGLESVNEYVRKDIRKPYSKQQMEQTICNMEKLGKYLRAYYIIGFPDETFEQIVFNTLTIMDMGIGTRCQNLQLYPDQKMLNEFHDRGFIDKNNWDWRLSSWYTPDTDNITFKELKMLRGYINDIGKCVEVLNLRPLSDSKEVIEKKFADKKRLIEFKEGHIRYHGNMYNISFIKNLMRFLIIKDGYKGAKINVSYDTKEIIGTGVNRSQNKLQEVLFKILNPDIKDMESVDYFFGGE